MRILNFLLVFMLVGLIPAFAAPRRVEIHNLTVAGIPVNDTLIPTNTTITTDSIYQSGNDGYVTVALTVGGNAGAITVDSQVSYDNINWWTPYVATGSTLTAQNVVANAITSNRWIIAPFALAPYVRYTISTGAVTNDTVTAETLWMDES